MPDLRIDVDGRELAAEWTDACPETRAAIAETLPLSGEARRWGDELYFSTPVDAPPENATARVPTGAVAYWPRGDALCLFWGPTPASEDGDPRAASPVNVIARIEDVSPLDGLDGGAEVRLQSA